MVFFFFLQLMSLLPFDFLLLFLNILFFFFRIKVLLVAGMETNSRKPKEQQQRNLLDVYYPMRPALILF